MANRYEPADKIIIGSSNTVFKKVENIKRFEAWDLCYTKKHLEAFPEKRFIDTKDGVIARFVITELHPHRKMTLLPERMIDGNDNDIAILLGENPDPDDEPPYKRGYCERKANHYHIIEEAMNGAKIYNPEEAFTNFFKAASITETDFTGWFPSDGRCYEEPLKYGDRDVSDADERFLKVSIYRNYPVGWKNGELIMTTWGDMSRRFIIEKPTHLDFCLKDEFTKPVFVNIEHKSGFNNTGNLKKIDFRKLRLLTKTNSINTLEDPKKRPYAYYSVYAGREDYRNRPKALMIIRRAPHLVSVDLDLPEGSSLEIFYADALESVHNTTKLTTFRCDRRMRRMQKDRKLYSFLENIAALEKPLADNMDISMGFFRYEGNWDGFKYYLKKFFKWLEESKNNNKISEPINLLERGYFFDADDF